MFRYLPKKHGRYINLGKKCGNLLVSTWSGCVLTDWHRPTLPWANYLLLLLCCDTPHTVCVTGLRYRFVCGYLIPLALQTCCFELNVQQGCQKHRGKILFNPTFLLCHHMNTIDSVLKVAKYELDLPPIGIEEDHLKGREIRSIRDKGVF